jgi:hypothetical protein
MSSPRRTPSGPVKIATSSLKLRRNSVHLGKARAHLLTERVQALGAVHPHHQDLPVALGLDDGHVFLSKACARRLPDPTIPGRWVKTRAGGKPMKIVVTIRTAHRRVA